MTDRVQLAARVPETVKNRYENKIAEVYGTTRPWAGTELERELRTQFGMPGGSPPGVSSDPEFGEKKLVRSEMVTSESVVANYRISPEVRQQISEYCDETGAHMGHFLGNVMIAIANSLSETGGNHQKREADGGVISVHPAATDQTDSPASPDSSDDRSTHDAVATRLDTGKKFTMDDFLETWEEVEGEKPSQYKIETYLPRVLDEIDYTWFETEQTAKPDLFMPKEEAPDTRDIRDCPHVLMDDDDMIEFVAVCALNGGRTSKGGWVINRAKIAERLTNIPQLGVPRADTIRRRMKRAAEKYEPLVYSNPDGDTATLTVLHTDAKPWEDATDTWELISDYVAPQTTE